MPTVHYFSPLVPVEWIAAHGLRPLRRIPQGRGVPASGARGLCPFAAGVMEELAAHGKDSAAILLSTCDQLRHAAALVGQGKNNVFLFVLPATWQTAAAERLCRAELDRMSDWLVALGGRRPAADELARVLREYAAARESVVRRRPLLSARQFATALADPSLAVSPAAAPLPGNSPAVRLALVGGPLLAEDYELYDLIERLGGRVVLDGTESGERTLPVLSEARIAADPLGAMIEAYYGQLPDAFRRPNDRLYDWLRHEIAARRVEGLILWRYVWCDLWHAEFGRMAEASRLPAMHLDAGAPGPAARGRIEGRLEAFFETFAPPRPAEVGR